MQVKLTVLKEEHQSWQAKGNMAAGESFNLVCMDVSQPSADRLGHAVKVRLSHDDKLTHWGKSVDKTVTFAVAKIAQNDSGEVALNGRIVEIK